MFRLLIDFNDVREGLVRGLREHAVAPRPLREEDQVLLHDDGEHEAIGTVERVDGDLIYLAIDWSTWTDAGTHPAESVRVVEWTVSSPALSAREHQPTVHWTLRDAQNVVRTGEENSSTGLEEIPGRRPRAPAV